MLLRAMPDEQKVSDAYQTMQAQCWRHISSVL